MPVLSSDYVTLADAAKRLKLTVPRVRQLIREMSIKTRRVGVVIATDDLAKMRARDKKPGPKAEK